MIYIYFKTPKFFGYADSESIKICFYDDVVYDYIRNDLSRFSVWKFYILSNRYVCIANKQHPDFSEDELNRVLSEQIYIETSCIMMTCTGAGIYHAPKCRW